jgi:uncharacterized protein YutE (UPF0331/DUF86 family)
MGKYRPDAVALSPSKKIAIEIKRNPGSSKNMKGIPELFAQHPDWELKVYYLSGLSQERSLRAPARQWIELAIEEVSELKNSGHVTAAMTTAWSALEAVGRALLPEKLARPQPAERLVEVLASEGLITPTEADSLRRAAELRNSVAHGELGSAVSPENVDELLASLRLLLGLLPKGQTSEG